MCTEFILPQSTPKRVSGRSMDFGADLPWIAAGIPANTPLKAFAHVPEHLPVINNAYAWKTRYDMVGISGGINIFKVEDFRDKMVDGLNSEGLSGAALWLPTSNYPKPSDTPKNAKLISALDIVSWVLSSYKTLKELEKDLKKIQEGKPIESGELLGFWDPFDIHLTHLIHKNYAPLHFQFHDKEGNSLVMEFRNGKMELTNNTDLGVMTNYPFIDWHRINMENYLSVSNLDVDTGKVVDMKLTANGHGNGTMALSTSPTPPSRFVRTAKLISFGMPWLNSLTGKEDEKAHAFAFNVLGNVTVVRLMSIDKISEEVSFEQKDNADYTQWVLVRDHKKPVILLRTADSTETFRLEFSEYIKAAPHYVKFKDLSLTKVM